MESRDESKWNYYGIYLPSNEERQGGWMDDFKVLHSYSLNSVVIIFYTWEWGGGGNTLGHNLIKVVTFGVDPSRKYNVIDTRQTALLYSYWSNISVYCLGAIT